MVIIGYFPWAQAVWETQMSIWSTLLLVYSMYDRAGYDGYLKLNPKKKIITSNKIKFYFNILKGLFVPLHY